MCFSAGASFTAGVLLTFAGTETLRKVHKPSQILFACIPLFFAFQQLTEGVLWVTMARSDYDGVQTASTYIFLFMAQVIWPLMVPLAMYFMETNKTRKKFLFGLVMVGSSVALYYLVSLIMHHAYAEISRFHIAYQSSFKDPYLKVMVFMYLAATLLPLFISSIKRTYLLGIIIGLSFIVSYFFYLKCLTSVWCFFAAVISFVIFYIIRDAHKKYWTSPSKLGKMIDKKTEVDK